MTDSSANLSDRRMRVSMSPASVSHAGAVGIDVQTKRDYFKQGGDAYRKMIFAELYFGKPVETLGRQSQRLRGFCPMLVRLPNSLRQKIFMQRREGNIMKKRIFAQIIAVLTAVSLLTTTAFAATFDELQGVIDREQSLVNEETNETRIGYDAGNVTLYENVEQGENGNSGIIIRGDDNINLDLNGHNIDARNEDGSNTVSGVITVEAGGKLTLDDSSVKDNPEAEAGEITGGNTADGLGAGLAACAHGKTIIYVTDGAAIYGNTAKGEGGAMTSSEKIDGQNLWADDGAFKAGAQDIFTAGNGAADDWNSEVFGKSGIVVGAQMLGGGNANWTGYLFRYSEDGKLAYKDGKPVWIPVTLDDAGSVIYAGHLLGVTAEPDDAAIKAAEEAAKAAAEGYVEISGNYSANHGGGAANNGTLIIGTDDGSLVDNKGARPEFTANKKLESTNPGVDNNRQLKAGEFTFVLTDEAGNEFTGTNDADGNVKFDFPKNYFTEAGEYTFTVTEKNTGKDGITYDETEYRVKVTVLEISLTDTPEEFEEVSDEEIPLTEQPEEEPVEIPEDDVPLADVPQTGDEAACWGFMALLSACGLLVLTMRKKDGENA